MAVGSSSNGGGFGSLDMGFRFGGGDSLRCPLTRTERRRNLFFCCGISLVVVSG